MCRLCAVLSDEAVLLADILLRPRMSLVRQSYAAQERRALPPGALPSMAYQQPFLNADGFGVGWYAPETLAGQESGAIRKPCVFTSLKPAWNDANLTNLSEEVRSPLILAHIRAAGPSLPVSDATCHPFRAGRLLFAHNGMVGDYEGVRRALLADLTDYAFTKAVQHGCIDSAVAFGVLLTELGVTDEEGALRERSAEELCGALGRMIKKIVAAVAGKEESLLNCVVCDDRSIVACRFATSPSAGGLHDGSEAEELQPLGASLYLSVGSRWVASPDDPMTYRMRKGADVKCCTAILSSEPLTSVREEWLPIAPNSVVVCRLSKGQSHPVDVLLYPLRQGPPPSVAALLDGSGQLEGATAAPALDSLAGAPAVPATAPALEAAPGSSAAAASRSEAWMTFTGHSEDVNCVTALCDGRVIAAGSMDGSFRLFDTASAKTLVVRRHSDSSGAVLALLALQGPSASSCLQSRESSPESSPASSPRRASPPASPGWPARRRASSFSGADLDVLLSTSQNELRVWDMTSCRTVGCSSACVGSEGEGPAELEVPCLFCFRFSPNQGQLLALAGTLDSLVLGFQSTRVFRLRLAEGWCRMMQTKRRSRTTKHVTLNVDTSQVTPSGRDCPSADGRSQKFCHHALLEPLHGGHIGFVYCVAHEPSAGVLASGGGDGRLVFWGPGGPRAVFPHGAAVLAMALSPGAEELFSGDVRGRIRIWDCSAVERGSRAVLSAGGAAAAVLSLAVAPVRGDAAAAPRCLLFAGDASGALRVWDPRRCVALREFSTSMTCCAALCTLGEPDEAPSGLLVRLACGGCSSGAVRRVDVVVPWADGDPAEDTHACSLCGDDSSFRGSAARRLLFLLLTDFVGIPTISTDPLFAPHLRRGTAWLSERFEELLGCTVRVSGHCIAARCGWDAARPLVVLYSHYDVVEPGSGWVTDPWQVSAADGYLHGRGVSDNKGPLLAQLFAVRRLLQARGAAPAAGGEDIVMRIDDKEEFSWSDSAAGDERRLRSSPAPAASRPLNVLFIADGAAEAGDVNTVRRLLREVKADGWMSGSCVAGVLVTNSSWIDDHRPCVCYGMRGVLDLEVQVVGGQRDLHSGSHGGLVLEPMLDLMGVCASLVDACGKPTVPGLMDGVREPMPGDLRHLEAAAHTLSPEALRRRLGVERGSGPEWLEQGREPGIEALRRTWLIPSVSITEVGIGPRHSHGHHIAHRASCVVSVRTTPCQHNEEIAAALQRHLEHEFAKRRTPNRLETKTLRACHWWEARTDSLIYKAARGALAAAWGLEEKDILEVREGGTTAVLPVLEEELGCGAVQLPLSQASDAVHLPNERMSEEVLHRAVDAIAGTLQRLAELIDARAAAEAQ